MLIRSKRIIVAGICSFSLSLASASGLAADVGKTNVMIGGQSSKLSTQYRSELMNNDHGTLKDDNTKPTKTTNITLNELKIGLDGQLTKESDYSVLLDLGRANVGGLIQTAKFNWWLTDMIGIGGGKIKINQGGWDFKNYDYSTLMGTVYTDTDMPLPMYAAGYELMVKAGGAGDISLQLTDDVVACTAKACAGNTDKRFNKENKQPAWTLQYMGDFGGIKPLFQLGSYDINHSKYIALGLGYEGMGLDAYLDFIQDSRMYALTVGTEDKKFTDTHSTYTLDVGYTIAKVARPFLKYSAFNVKDATDSAVTAIATEPTSNATPTAAGTSYEDNATQWALGSSFLMEGNHFRPYFALVNTTGKFAKAVDPTTSESKSDMQIKLGVMGTF